MKLGLSVRGRRRFFPETIGLLDANTSAAKRECEDLVEIDARNALYERLVFPFAVNLIDQSLQGFDHRSVLAAPTAVFAPI